MALAKGLQPERHSLSLRVRSFPFVSSEVETPIGTARSRGASRLRSMRTDMGFFMRIGIVAPSTPLLPDDAEAARAVVSLGSTVVDLEFAPPSLTIAATFPRQDETPPPPPVPR